MGFEQINQTEKPKSKKEMVLQKQTELEQKIAQLDSFAEHINDPAQKAEYNAVLSEIKKLNEEIVSLLSELDLEDVDKDLA